MTVIIDQKTKILIQGFTGKMGTFHAEEMINYGFLIGKKMDGKRPPKNLLKIKNYGLSLIN